MNNQENNYFDQKEMSEEFEFFGQIILNLCKKAKMSETEALRIIDQARNHEEAIITMFFNPNEIDENNEEYIHLTDLLMSLGKKVNPDDPESAFLETLEEVSQLELKN